MWGGKDKGVVEDVEVAVLDKKYLPSSLSSSIHTSSLLDTTLIGTMRGGEAEALLWGGKDKGVVEDVEVAVLDKPSSLSSSFACIHTSSLLDTTLIGTMLTSLLADTDSNVADRKLTDASVCVDASETAFGSFANDV